MRESCRVYRVGDRERVIDGGDPLRKGRETERYDETGRKTKRDDEDENVEERERERKRLRKGKERERDSMMWNVK